MMSAIGSSRKLAFSLSLNRQSVQRTCQNTFQPDLAMRTSPFDHFIENLQGAGPDAALAGLCLHFANSQRFSEFFEMRKIQMRHRLGLPAGQWQSLEELPPELSKRVEEGLLEICRETGTMLIQSGQIAAGWSYLEPVGDRKLVRELLSRIEPVQENIESLIHLWIGQGIDPPRGFRLVLERFGTCSGITTYESQLARLPVEARREIIGLLVEHVYQELSRNIDRSLRGAVAGEGHRYKDGFIESTLKNEPGLTGGTSHHIDATHLISTVRYAALLLDRRLQGLAIELAGYGQSLHADFQFPGAAPFERTCIDTGNFLQALRNGEGESVVARLRDRAEELARDRRELDTASWLVYLLDALGRGEEALDAWFKWLHQPAENSSINEEVSPSLAQLVERHGLHDNAMKRLKENADLAGFATIAVCRYQSCSAADSGQKKQG
jgi:hypothetical protein